MRERLACFFASGGGGGDVYVIRTVIFFFLACFHPVKLLAEAASFLW